jgi:hypothetical protein
MLWLNLYSHASRKQRRQVWKTRGKEETKREDKEWSTRENFKILFGGACSL